MATVSLYSYLERLRLQIGDTEPSSYRYTDEWLYVALTAAVETLQPWWNWRYLLDSSDEAYRNSAITFEEAEPPVIQRGDIRPIILMASIVLKGGSLENMAWNLGAWRDAEISYSNIEGGRSKNMSLQRDWDELLSILKPPQKKLSFTRKAHLPGYTGNTYEQGSDQ